MSERDAIKPGLYDAAEFVGRQPMPPVIVPSALPAIDAPVLVPPVNRWRRRFLLLLGASLAFFTTLQLVGFVAAAAAFAPGLGWIASGLIGTTLLAGALWARGEIAEFRRIARVEALQEESLRLLAEDHAGVTGPWVARVMRQLADQPKAGPGIARFQAMTIETYAARDSLLLFEREVMGDLDRAALDAVSRAVRDSAVGTAASPLAILDALIVLLRALRMVREVAGAYGFRPGGFGALVLLRRVLANASAVAAADLVADLTADVVGGLGHKVAGTLSARLGVGVFTAMRMARLGVATMRACRPMPFLREKPQIAQIVRQALGWRGDDGV